MSVYKTAYLLPILVWFASCKPSSLSFRPARELNKNLFANIQAILKNESFRIDSVGVYRARLEEQMIERDEIPQFKLVNDKSKKFGTTGLEMGGNFHHLYFFVVHTSPEKNICIFLSTGFNTHSECTALGPAYLGNLRYDRINFFKSLKINEAAGGYQFQESKEKTLMHFYFDAAAFRQSPSVIRISQIIRDEPNKISGLKPVIYNITKIFNDADALVFTYETTYK